jgi:Ca2+-binding EF-hand superfamily protein
VTHDDKSVFPYKVQFDLKPEPAVLWAREAHVVRAWPVGQPVQVRNIPLPFAQLIMEGELLPPAAEALLGTVGTVEGHSQDGKGRHLVGGFAWAPEMLEPPGGYPPPTAAATPAAGAGAAAVGETASTGAAAADAAAAEPPTPGAATTSEDFLNTWGIAGNGGASGTSGSASSASAEEDEEVVVVTIPAGWTPSDFQLLSLADKMGGVHVTKVEGKAVELGFKQGDVVVALNGLPCRGRPFAEVFPQMVLLARLGLACELGVARTKKEEMTEELYFEVIRSGVASVDLLLAHCPPSIVHYVRGDEFATYARSAYTELDADGSGTIEPSELLPVLKTMAEGAGMVLDNEERWAKTFLEIFDADGNGHLSLHEYVELLTFFVVSKAAMDCGVDIGEVCAEGEFKMMLRRKELDNQLENVRVGIKNDDFSLKVLEKKFSKELPAFKALAKEEFAKLDRDGNGTLDASEFRTVLLTMIKAETWAVTEQHVASMMATFDLNKNGKISFAEFEKMYRVFGLIGLEAMEKEAEAHAAAPVSTN